MKFWVAALAAYEELLRSTEVIRLPKGTINTIRMILNRRYKPMIDNAPSDCYLTALFVDPGEFVVSHTLPICIFMPFGCRLPQRICC